MAVGRDLPVAGTNVLGEGRERLVSIRDEVLALEAGAGREAELSEMLALKEKELRAAKKRVREEQDATVNERREEVAATFYEETKKLERTIREENAGRRRNRQGQVTERVNVETADYALENENIRETAKLL